MEEPLSYVEQKKQSLPPEKFLNKSLPQNDEAEKTALGASLIDPSIFVHLAEYLEPDDFYSPTNRRIYKAMLSLFNDGRSIDPIMISEELKRDGSDSIPGGIATISNLTYGLPHFTEAQIIEYCKLIQEKSRIRALIRAVQDLSDNAISESLTSEALIQGAEEAIYALSNQEDPSEFSLASDLFQEKIEVVQQIQQAGDPVTGLPTGFVDLDSLTAGFHRQNLIILGARPSMGKTALGLKIVQNAAFRYGKTAAVFSIEMSKEELIARILCSEAGVDGHRFRTGLISHDDWDRINEATELIEGSKLFINDDPDIGVMKMRQKLKRLQAQQGQVDIVLVDYLQLMHGEKAENRQQEMTKISRGLKKLAKEFNVPILALSQLSRGPEHRAANNHRPQIGDLRESGAIEQDADVVLLLYREEFYPKPDGTVVGQGEAEVNVAKQRNGPTDVIKLAFDKESTSFGDYVPGF